MDAGLPITTLGFWGPTATTMAVIGGGIIIWCVLSLYRQRHGPLAPAPGAKPSSPKAPAPPSALDRTRQDRALQRDLTEVAAEIEQLAKRLGAQLDSQAARLEALIRQADARIARLQQLPPEVAPPSAATNPPGIFTALNASREKVAQTAGSLRGATNPAPPRLPSSDSGAALIPDDPLARQVYQLADAGLGPPDIAKKVGEHVGKVELILALRSG
jgi:hypothetical protein